MIEKNGRLEENEPDDGLQEVVSFFKKRAFAWEQPDPLEEREKEITKNLGKDPATFKEIDKAFGDPDLR